jgi:hypothetical protein
VAALADAERQKAWAELMRNADLALQGVLKSELRAAVDAVDAWVDSNSTSFNTAIPQPARSALTAKQKAALLMYVVDRRFGVL